MKVTLDNPTVNLWCMNFEGAITLFDCCILPKPV